MTTLQLLSAQSIPMIDYYADILIRKKCLRRSW